MSGTYPIKGIPLPTDPDPNHLIPVRQEIDAWYSNPDNAIQVSLFIQAMDKFQKMKITEQLSYYRIAGIHGQPRVEWDGVKGGGFCKHNTATFPTWHRPYVLLLEQRLYEIMLNIIDADVPDDEKQEWKRAASHWRFPYWDWALKRKWFQPEDYGVPELVFLPQIQITLPHNQTRTLANPLYQFTNPSLKPMGDKAAMGEYALQTVEYDSSTRYEWTRCVATSKFGILNKPARPESWVYGVQNIEATNEALRNPKWYLPKGAEGPTHKGSIGETVYRMFSKDYFNSWEAFASTHYIQENSGKNFLSLEYIHNNIHSFVGGTSLQTGLGHMGDPLVAAFDPIFWLHHCNVDRLVAIFQTLYPDKWFDSPSRDDSKPTDSLEPFHVDTENHFWCSDKTRDWTELNYQYDNLDPLQSFQDQRVLKREDYIPELNKMLNKYSTRLEFTQGSSISGDTNDYIVNILYDRYALNGQSYTIHFFIGTVEGDAHTYALQPNHVGSVYTFSNGSNPNEDSECANCKDQMERGALSTAQIHITIPLLKDAQNRSISSFNTLNPEDVHNYLTTNLHWKAEAMGEPIGMDRLPRTKIYVLQGTAEHTTNDTELSYYHSYTPMWDTCAGKPGAGHESDNLE